MDWSNIHDEKTVFDKKFDDFHAKVSSCAEQNASLKKATELKAQQRCVEGNEEKR